MAETTRVTVSKSWVKLSDSDCTVQANSNEQIQFAISPTEPTTDASLLLRIAEPVTLAYKTAVWCRLPFHCNTPIIVNIVK